MALIGYARVSTDEQVTDTQIDDLTAAGCQVIFQEHVSSVARARPELSKSLARLKRGDTLLVVRLDRLARSLKHLIEILEQLDAVGADFRSLNDPIDTSTPQGRFTLQVLGAVAELERGLISQRTKASLQAARARGRVGGNPQLKARDPDAIRRLSRSRAAAYMFKISAAAEEWLPTVRRLRPAKPWDEVTASLNASLPPGRRCWTPERLKRATKRLIADGLADEALLMPAPPKRDDRQLRMVALLVRSNPAITLAKIGRHLEEAKEKAPRGGSQWSMSSVKNTLDRARRAGLLDQVAPQEA